MIPSAYAQRTRTAGGRASIVPEELQSGSALKPVEGALEVKDASDIIASVAEDMEALITSMRSAIRQIDALGEDQGSVDYLATTLREHEKFDWMLRQRE